MKFSRHYLGLALAIALGTILRFWNLDYKPLWLDEVITALFTLGKSYDDIPVETVFSLNRLSEIFSFNSAVSCPQIAENIVSQSTHPPLFFCLINYWLTKLGTDYSSLITDLRALPAFFGVGAIAAIYYLSRVAFDKSVGLMAAAFMAVSPFGVYISQEARHYTLPVFLISLSLLGLIQIQQDLHHQKIRPICWLSWVVVNTIGLYTHYFFIIALIAELVTLLFVFFATNRPNPPNPPSLRGKGGEIRGDIGGGIEGDIEGDLAGEIREEIEGKMEREMEEILLPSPRRRGVGGEVKTLICWLLPFIFFIPWLSTLIGHFHRPETSWLPSPHNIAPIYQTLAAWILMAIALPVENQPIWVIIPATLLMILFFGWFGWQVFQGLKELINKPVSQNYTITLGIFTICVLLEFLAIVYILGKDITIAPRYNFVYYPAFCTLVATSLVNSKLNHQKLSLNHPYSVVLSVGLISCIFVVNSLAFLKPYNPEKVAKNMLGEPNIPLMVVVAYQDSQDVALGMSFALALDKFGRDPCTVNPENCPEFAFFNRNSGYDSVWQKISKLSLSKRQVNLWVVAPGLRRQDYPPQLSISDRSICSIDRNNYYRVGIPYQLYRCIGDRG